MNRNSTLYLKIALSIMGLIVLTLCIFWLPWQAGVFAFMYPEFSYLKYPLLIGLYMTAVPFFFALYQAWKLLNAIDRNQAFSKTAVKRLISIKYCAAAIFLLYLIGEIFIISQNAGNPGIVLMGMIIMFSSIVISIFAALLQKLLKNALMLKEENELTV
ncbi:DUF2975 domain-containing protein [Rossellomorea vietnamensis]|uniref:DUF2975 domain-containing protein n=1 Tax=Rossellomorea vietnamensis TaxID=218284 RepID=A0A5D4MD03_9BACI|nr:MULTISPECIES: DUF2975 domain-containing protein [Bacillaceae]TYR99213.1 DUF2975 domain-containing protein [Rossellomorea vietnamensis]